MTEHSTAQNRSDKHLCYIRDTTTTQMLSRRTGTISITAQY